MNILYINHYAGSPSYGMEYRPFYLAREWVRAGHKVLVVAANESHIRTVIPSLGTEKSLDEVIQGVSYTWLRTPPYKGNGIARVWNMASFVRQLYSRARDFSTGFKPDVVIASSTYPMDVYAAKRIARLAGAKLVFEVHDRSVAPVSNGAR